MHCSTRMRILQFDVVCREYLRVMLRLEPLMACSTDFETRALRCGSAVEELFPESAASTKRCGRNQTGFMPPRSTKSVLPRAFRKRRGCSTTTRTSPIQHQRTSGTPLTYAWNTSSGFCLYVCPENLYTSLFKLFIPTILILEERLWNISRASCRPRYGSTCGNSWKVQESRRRHARLN